MSPVLHAPNALFAAVQKTQRRFKAKSGSSAGRTDRSGINLAVVVTQVVGEGRFGTTDVRVRVLGDLGTVGLREGDAYDPNTGVLTLIAKDGRTEKTEAPPTVPLAASFKAEIRASKGGLDFATVLPGDTVTLLKVAPKLMNKMVLWKCAAAEPCSVSAMDLARATPKRLLQLEPCVSSDKYGPATALPLFSAPTEAEAGALMECESACIAFQCCAKPSYVLEEKSEILVHATYRALQWRDKKGSAKPTQVLVDLKIFESTLACLGMLDPASWGAIAPVIVPKLDALMLGYVSGEMTQQMDVNQSPTEDVAFGLTLGCQALVADLPAFYAKVGLPVSLGFVRERVFGGDAELRSDFAAQNPLNRGGSSIINLSEHTGSLDAFAEGWDFWLVSNVDLDAEDRSALLGMSESNREACLAKQSGAKLKVRYATAEPVWNVFAVRGEEAEPSAKRQKVM